MSTTREDRIRGTLLGQAAGDALGSPYEFRTPPKIGEARFGRGTFGHEPGEFTDDTQLATCIAAAHSDPGKTAENILNWYNARPLDVGISTSRLLSVLDYASDMVHVSRNLGESRPRQRPAGWDPGMANGSLMRTGPACLPHLGNRDKIAEVARTLSDLTHYDPDGWTGDACVIWSLLIDEAVEQGEPFDLRFALSGALSHIPQDRRGFWQNTVTAALYGAETPKRNGSAVSAFKCALAAVAHAESLADGLQRAVAMGDDTDTVAAIAGSLLGAIYGASAIPADWRQMLHGWTPRGRTDADGLEGLALEAAGVTAGQEAGK